MSTKLNGRLVLSKIPKELIRTNDAGEKYIYVDVVERRKAGKYGDTHSIQIWTKESGTIYLGDLKPMEFGGGAAAPVEKAPVAMGIDPIPDPNRVPLYQQAEQYVSGGVEGDLPF